MKKTLTLLVLSSTVLFASSVYSQDNCCSSCICPPGKQGSQGSTGAQGVAGPQGIQGLQGVSGEQGSIGAQGPQGSLGVTGPTGPCCPVSTSLANIFSTQDQTLNTGEPVLFQNVNAIAPADYDLSLMNSTGQVTFLRTGIYSISFTVEALLTPPFPNPVPAWSFSLYLDGSPVPGGCFSSFTLFPDELTTSIAGTVIIFVSAGQSLTLQSASTLPVSILSSVPGSILPVTSASIAIMQH